ncbi:hypothetical protein JZ751_012455 [Albula glossodonta]|uniref:Homeobox domain-containing protein n=1 Tax=Albula glossodonta TaxID=121402 RepID=A0A8T2NXD4_9TELE|nr:hypothetical protein JZ751_012455 [Albula glossodonta]
MQLPPRPVGTYGYPLRPFAPLYPEYAGSHCSASSKPTSGKSFTIDALLGRSDQPGNERKVAAYGFTSSASRTDVLADASLPVHAEHDTTTSKANVQSFKHKGGKSKRMRTSFTNEQLSRLEKEFARQQYMVGSERFILASALHLTEAQVKVWFQNRRIKWRKQSLEQQQAKLAKLGLAAPQKSPGSQGREDEGDEEEEIDFSADSDVDVQSP